MKAILGLLLLMTTSSFSQIIPKKLLIYYSYPSSLNYPANGYNLTNVAIDLAQYEYVILGARLEEADHPDHANTQTIINNPLTATTKFFGYIDLGVSTSNYAMADIQSRVEAWKAMGADGIFFDDFGYDFLVTRTRQNAAVQYVHSKSMPVVANAWNPDDAFGSQLIANSNPTGIPPQLQAQDYYLSESFLIQEGLYSNPADWLAKAGKLKNYQLQIGFKIFSITTNNQTNSYSEQQFFYAWYGAFVYGHEATGWGEFNFSANTAIAPFRTRPNVATPGTSFRAAEQLINNRLARYTNTGQLWIDISTHTYGFIPCSACQSLKSGSWQDVSVWDCGHIPLACDQVVIKPGHVVTLNETADTQRMTIQGRLRTGLFKVRLTIF